MSTINKLPFSNQFEKGHSFNWAGDWTPGKYYKNDEYVTDFVVYNANVVLYCRENHIASTSTEPELIYKDGKIIGVNSIYWGFVLHSESMTHEELIGVLQDDFAAKQDVIETVNVTVDDNTGVPSATAHVSGNEISFDFKNLKGNTGNTGPRGPKGEQGNTGSSVDYQYELINNLTTNDPEKGLSAAQGKVLNEKIDRSGGNYIVPSTSIYKSLPNNINPALLGITDLVIKNSNTNYYYWVQVYNSSNLQQLTLFKTDSSHMHSYLIFNHFKYSTDPNNFDSGLCKYTTILSSGEEATIKINWNIIGEVSLNTMYPDTYVLQDWVFNNGRKDIILEDINGNNIIPGSLPDSKFLDNSVNGKKLLDSSVSNIKVKDKSTQFSTLSTLGYKPNLISTSNFKIPENQWTSGQIDTCGNTIDGNILKFTSSANAGWQSYITCFVKASDLKDKIGIDLYESTKYLDFELKSNFNPEHGTWVILRYAENDNPAFYPSGDTDAVFNINGSHQGLGYDDEITWAERSVTFTSTTYLMSNLKVPGTYNAKKLYAILFCIGGGINGEQKILEDIGIYVHDENEKTKAFFTVPSYIDKINNDIAEIKSVLPDAEFNGYYAAIGDSITNANHDSIEDILEDDPYLPIDGYSGVYLTYKRKCYAYYIAKKYNLQWANYGWGGSTLSSCASKAYPSSQLHPFVDDRISQLKEGIDWDFISIFFGWNDKAFGPTSQKDKWLQSTYSEDIGYPVNSSQIGAPGFATQSQKDACDAVKGTVDGVYYDNAEDYFFAKWLGNIDSNDKSTWYGAWNYTMQYLMKKYKNAKFLIVAPFVDVHVAQIKTAVHSIANKYGVNCFDFNELPYWYYGTNNTTPLLNPDDANGYWYTGNGNRLPATISGYNQARLSWDTLHPSNLGYRTLSGPFGNTLMN